MSKIKLTLTSALVGCLAYAATAFAADYTANTAPAGNGANMEAKGTMETKDSMQSIDKKKATGCTKRVKHKKKVHKAPACHKTYAKPCHKTHHPSPVCHNANHWRSDLRDTAHYEDRYN